MQLRLSRLRQQRFCREAAMKVCSRRWLPNFCALISAIDAELDRLHDQCKAENAKLAEAVSAMDKEVTALKESAAYRTGMFLTCPFRMCWRMLKAARVRRCVAASEEDCP